MKNKIGIVIIVLISILISCVLVSVGGSPGSTYITLDSRSALMQPKFCLYADRYFQKRLDIGTIIVRKAKRSSSEKKRLELDLLFRIYCLEVKIFKRFGTYNISIVFWQFHQETLRVGITRILSDLRGSAVMKKMWSRPSGIGRNL